MQRHSQSRCRTPVHHRPAARVEVWSLPTLWRLSTASSFPNDSSALMLAVRCPLVEMTTCRQVTAKGYEYWLHEDDVVSTIHSISAHILERA
jgi:hypothetical protein